MLKIISLHQFKLLKGHFILAVNKYHAHSFFHFAVYNNGNAKNILT